MAKRALNAGNFSSPYTEPRGEAIAMRLSESVDRAARQAVGWQSKAQNPALRDWIEEACKQRLHGAPAVPLETLLEDEALLEYSIAQIRATADRVAMTIQPRDRLRVQKAFKALIGELLANGD